MISYYVFARIHKAFSTAEKDRCAISQCLSEFVGFTVRCLSAVSWDPIRTIAIVLKVIMSVKAGT